MEIIEIVVEKKSIFFLIGKLINYKIFRKFKKYTHVYYCLYHIY